MRPQKTTTDSQPRHSFPSTKDGCRPASRARPPPSCPGPGTPPVRTMMIPVWYRVRAPAGPGCGSACARLAKGCVSAAWPRRDIRPWKATSRNSGTAPASSHADEFPTPRRVPTPTSSRRRRVPTPTSPPHGRPRVGHAKEAHNKCSSQGCRARRWPGSERPEGPRRWPLGRGVGRGGLAGWVSLRGSCEGGFFRGCGNALDPAAPGGRYGRGHSWERVVRLRPTLPHRHQCSTIGAEGLSFRVRNGTGRFPFAMTAETLWRYQFPDRISGTTQWTRAATTTTVAGVVKLSAY